VQRRSLDWPRLPRHDGSERGCNQTDTAWYGTGLLRAATHV
jgi:hypothetical protein